MPRFVIVGGVAGGASAAARLRRQDENAEIVILERDKYVSYANCGLPYYIGGVIENRETLFVSTPEKLKGEFNIDVRTENEVTRIDRQERQVEVRRLSDGQTYSLSYDKLILTPGARPAVPPLRGINLPSVFTMRNVADADAIKARVDVGDVQDAVVVGGGFIGLEMAENLLHRGVRVTLVEMLDQVMIALDPEMAALLHEEIMNKGVRLSLGDALQEIAAGANNRLVVKLASGRSAEADMVVLAIGVRPESGLASAAGLDLGPRGHIVVNEFMQTSDPDIYAVGDAVQVRHSVTGNLTAVPLAGPANRQARIAADHISGKPMNYRGAQGTSIVKAFDLTAACAGTNSRLLEHEGIAFLTSITHSADHVTYYPGSSVQTIKLFYAPTDGKLLGAQVVGRKAVDRTINVLATAISAGLSVFDLEHLELAYAPPYGAAKDPVNIAGYVASNRLRGDTELVEWKDLLHLDSDRVGLLDVRMQPEWDAGHIPGSVHIPNVQLRSRLEELSKDKEWIMVCAIGRRAYVMERMLKQKGYRVKTLSGGWNTYRAATAKQSNFDTWQAPQGDLPICAAASQSPAPTAASAAPSSTLDARGLQCPGPILAVYKRMQDMQDGQVLEVVATDPGFARDAATWAERTGNTLLSLQEQDGVIRASLQKGSAVPQVQVSAGGALPSGKTIVVFSGELDRALAAFVIANGAAAMGKPVSMFFTFWGLNILRKRQSPAVRKNPVERMFGWMLPKGAEALKLSKLNMGGLGTWMMKQVMNAKNVDPLPQLIKTAQENGVKFIACQMSMDIMGIKREELIDGIEVGGVATYIGETDKANASLFI